MRRSIVALAFLAVPQLYAVDAALPDRQTGCSVVSGNTSTTYRMVVGHTWRYDGSNPTITLKLRAGIEALPRALAIPVVVSTAGGLAKLTDPVIIPAGATEVTVPSVTTRFGLGTAGLVSFLIAGSPCGTPEAHCQGILNSPLDVLHICTNTVDTVVDVGPMKPSCSDDRTMYPNVPRCNP